MSGDDPASSASAPAMVHISSDNVHLKPQDNQNKDLPTAKLSEFDPTGVTLIEDDFAQFFDDKGHRHSIKRFTWKNRNKIQVQVISYGARVISIKLPDRNGKIEDVLLGFDDLAGYIFYEKFYFGAVIGRVSNVIKNGSFVVDNARYDVSANYLGKHCFNGGFNGLDKVPWDTYVTKKKVIMSHVSPHLSEGFPGNLLVRVSFELSAKNEFRVGFEAQTTQPTCVDLSHLLYFNMAGHYAGSEEIYRHILTMNCNCFTPQVDKIPTGEIFNVLHSDFDLQVPKLLGKVIGITPKDGFDQNLCVNRGMYQDLCFVGRILHPPSGRMLEVYSNQPGVQLNTANDFGYGIIPTFNAAPAKQEPDQTMLLYQKVHDKVTEVLKLDEKQSFKEIQQLIAKLSSVGKESPMKFNEQKFKVTLLQSDYLNKAKEVVCENGETDDETCLDLKRILSTILENLEIEEQQTNSEHTNQSTSNIVVVPPVKDSNRLKKSTTKLNPIPVYYKNSNQIIGKERALYKTHGGIALQTQNYPNAVNVKQFPKCILNPGEVYKHDVVYRFWIRAGNPSKWIRRNLNETKNLHPCVDNLPK